MKTFHSIFILLFSSIVFATCINENNRPSKASDNISNINTALPTEVTYPASNPISTEKIELGRLLFFDPILSGNKDVACATCHHPDHGYAEFLDQSIGVNGVGLSSKRSFNKHNNIPRLRRNSQTILNTAFNGIKNYVKYDPSKAPMFWDLRATTLEEQALEPIITFEEMRGPHFTEEEILAEVLSRLHQNEEYQLLFAKAFNQENPIRSDNLAKALASFERTLVANNSRYDQFKRGDDDAISLSEKEGLKLFTKVGCANCHNGPMFSDYKAHVLGVKESELLSKDDKGFEDSYAFRTPTLRNLRFTAPYMHNGSIKTLKQVLEFYEDISQNKTINQKVPPEDFDPLIHELNLRLKDMQPIISFINALNDNNFSKEIPDEVPSGLPVGGNI